MYDKVNFILNVKQNFNFSVKLKMSSLHVIISYYLTLIKKSKTKNVNNDEE